MGDSDITHSGTNEENAWGGVEENTDDPEEVRVIFSAFDSFM